MPDIQMAMSLLINAFEKYAKKDGDNHVLSKAELRDLLQEELKEMLGNAPDKTAVDRLFKELDENGDNSVDFKEFGKMIFCLTVMCHECFTCKK
ncbi:ictacalcin-like [Notolabrus celidotus]|uniref:ictacalcin-like n=1 Tax=Notolabrus celidotus TaxID=1203425 RepID=UPI00148FD01F|nr:ictacalcin-like [Notolabrus celidotus]